MNNLKIHCELFDPKRNDTAIGGLVVVHHTPCTILGMVYTCTMVCTMVCTTGQLCPLGDSNPQPHVEGPRVFPLCQFVLSLSYFK